MGGWPSDSELAQFLVSAKVCKTAPEWITGAMASIVAQWEDLTGWRPFLSDGSSSTVRLSPPDDGTLWLPGGFISVASIYVGVTDSDAGTLLTPDTDYRLEPDNGPYERVCGLALRGTVPRSVQVTGVQGRMLESDPRFEDVKFKVVRGAAASVFFEASGQDGPLTRVKQGPVELEYSDNEGKSRMDSWAKDFISAVQRYRRNAW